VSPAFLRTLAFCLAVPIFVAHCKEQPKAPTLLPRDGRLGARRCSSLPGPKNKQVPILQRPFDNQYRVIHHFDHETPGAVKPYDPSSKELTYCGLEMIGLIEGTQGYSWAMPVGTHVLAAQEGEVVFAGKKEPVYCPTLSKMLEGEWVVELKHATLGDVGYSTTYSNLSKVTVKVGQKVNAGTVIGHSGQSGCVTEPLLFFVVRKLSRTKRGTPTVVDPYGWDGTMADPWEMNEQGSPSLYLWMEGEAPTLDGW
jgi:murein DD-endopeptidase MepM/ murein hydrolase activator NlpD